MRHKLNDTILIHYGKKEIPLTMTRTPYDVFAPTRQGKDNCVSAADIADIVRNAFAKLFRDRIDVGVDTVAIVINDKTRPVPHRILLPPLLQVLSEFGIERERIYFLIASGTHTPMRKDENLLILPESIANSYEIFPHNCDDTSNLVYKGVTSRGTPVFVNTLFDKATLKIVVGDIEPHHFAGFSGGAKSASIGLCGRQTITRNHTLLLDERSCVGNYETNPLRQDIEEIGQMIGVDLALNAVIDEAREIKRVFCGPPLEVMQAGIACLRDWVMVPILHKYDLVIASAGGYPKDINFYQAQKALTNASMFCKDGGMVFLVAECVEGVGSERYQQFMQGVPSHEAAVQKFVSQGFAVGPHKAYQVGKIAERVRFKLLSKIDPDLLRELLIEPIEDINLEIKAFLETHPGASVAVLPHATVTIPEVQGVAE
jgi:nickel-dependent lactate racemase